MTRLDRLDLPIAVDDRDRVAGSPTTPPVGTVALLFTDIEGSTALVRALGDEWGDVLEQHHELVGEAIRRHGGYVDRTEGDAFVAVFDEAPAAVQAAVEAQRELVAATWPPQAGPRGLRVRMGVHVGAVERRKTGYVGLEMHRAARIASAAHGGQLLLSATARALVRDIVPVEDLGLHRLKDFPAPEPLACAVIDGCGANAFPPPVEPTDLGAAAEGGASTLPVPATPTVGREREVDAVTRSLKRGEVRVVTLVGPGGVGKTRLAAEIARSLGTRVEGVALESVGRADDVAAAMVERLGIDPLADEPPKATLRRFLAPKELVLVVDNFEHVLDAAPLVGELVAAAPAVSVLATSREPLGLSSEHQYPVSPLDPRAAIAVFRGIAERRNPDFAMSQTVSRLCERLDGLPLAIELAAARTVLFSPDELLARIGGELDLLSHGPRDAPERQRTLRSTLEWSYRLLADDERKAFDAFAVFAGGAGLRAAEAVTAATLETLESLVSKSLLIRRGERLTMLQTIRAFAVERLDDTTRWRHARHFAAMADEGDAQMFGPEEGLWLDRLDADSDNIRTAFAWTLERAPDLALRLAGKMSHRWSMVAPLEGRRWLDAALAAAGDTAPPQERAIARRELAYQLDLLGIDGAADAEAALRLAGATDDPALEVRARMTLAFVERHSHPARARALAERAVHEATAIGLDRDIMNAHLNLARIATGREKATIGEAAMRAVRECGNRRLECILYADLAHTALLDARYDEAETLAHSAAALVRDRWPRLIAVVFANLGLAKLLREQMSEAQVAFARSLEAAVDRVMPDITATALGGLAAVAARGDEERCATLLGAAVQHGSYAVTPLADELERRFFDPARRVLGDRAWNAARAAGARLAPLELAGLGPTASR